MVFLKFLQYLSNTYQNQFVSFQKQHIYFTLLNIFYHFITNYLQVPNTTEVVLYNFLIFSQRWPFGSH